MAVKFNVEVCDWTQIDAETKYAVSVNESVRYNTDSLDDAHLVARLMRESFNAGLRAMMLAAQGNKQGMELDDSAFSKRTEFVVTPEMQKARA